MRTHINDMRLAVHGIIQPPNVESWLTVYASPEASEDEMIRIIVAKMQQIIGDSPSCSPFWGRPAHETLQELCRGTWWRRIVARIIVEQIIREDVRKGLITTSPGCATEGRCNYTRFVQIKTQKG